MVLGEKLCHSSAPFSAWNRCVFCWYPPANPKWLGNPRTQWAEMGAMVQCHVLPQGKLNLKWFSPWKPISIIARSPVDLPSSNSMGARQILSTLDKQEMNSLFFHWLISSLCSRLWKKCKKWRVHGKNRHHSWQMITHWPSKNWDWSSLTHFRFCLATNPATLPVLPREVSPLHLWCGKPPNHTPSQARGLSLGCLLTALQIGVNDLDPYPKWSSHGIWMFSIYHTLARAYMHSLSCPR